MPELPEVETVRRGLAPVLEGRVLARVIQRRKDLRFPFPRGFAKRLQGRRVERLDRRAKYLIAHLEGDLALIVHLGMSGRFTILGGPGQVGAFVHETAAGTDAHGPHDHVVFETDAGTRIVYTDHRRFGLMDLCRASKLEAHRLLAAMGIEPLDARLDGTYLRVVFAGKRAPVKAALLDQRLIGGLGNIYVCEALYRAGIGPRRSCGSIGPRRAGRLAAAIRQVIAEAIEAGGSTLRDYARVDGELGYFQHRFRVYDREGALCPDRGCGPIKRIVQSGRSTYYCPGCQH